MFGKKKIIENPAFIKIREAFAGNIYFAEQQYHGNLAWVSLDPTDFIGIAKELLPQKKRVIFEYDEHYHDLYLFFFYKDRVMYVCEVKKWIKVVVN
jgi:hypothetical protein